MPQKLVADSFLILVKNRKQPLHARNCFKDNINWKEDYQKALKRLTLLFLSNLVPFNGQDYKKEKELGTCNQSLVRKIPLSMKYYLTKFDDVI